MANLNTDQHAFGGVQFSVSLVYCCTLKINGKGLLYIIRFYNVNRTIMQVCFISPVITPSCNISCNALARY